MSSDHGELMRILSLDGGGYLGLAAAAFLKGAEEHFGTRAADRFDLFCGTSTGAIIALALANGLPAAKVVTLYEGLGPKIFPPRPQSKLRKLIKDITSAKYDSKPLVEALSAAFGMTTLGDVLARGKYVLITAYNRSNGTPKIFKTDHGEHLTAHSDYYLRDVALASAAAPTFFPMVKLRNPTTETDELLCDGGLFANHPALLGYAEAIYDLKVPPSDIEILSLATPRADRAEWASARAALDEPELNRGLWQWRDIHSVMIDATSAVSHTALARIVKASGGGACYERIAFPQPEGLGLDVVTTGATETLRQLGGDIASRTDVRERIARFFRP